MCIISKPEGFGIRVFSTKKDKKTTIVKSLVDIRHYGVVTQYKQGALSLWRVDEKLKRLHYVVSFANRRTFGQDERVFIQVTALHLHGRFSCPHKATSRQHQQHLLQRHECLFVRLNAAAHLVCRQRWERRTENLSPVGIFFSTLPFNEPQKIAAGASFQSQIKAERTKPVSELERVVGMQPQVD